MLLNRLELKRVLKELAVSVEKKDQSLITSNVFFEDTGAGVTLTTCDGETYTEIAIATDEAISFDVNFKELKKFVDGLKGDTVEFAINDLNKIVAVSGNNAIMLDQHSVNNEDMERYTFEVVNGTKYDQEIIVNDAVFGAIDSNNPKFELNGLLVDFRNGMIVGCDTRRLAYSSIEAMDCDSIIIPKQGLKKGSVISDMHYGKCERGYESVNYKLDGITKRSRLINGKYPEYERIIPKNTNFSIKINGADLKENLSKFGDTELIFKNNVVTATDIESNNSVYLPCDYPSDVSFAMTIQMKYILDAVEDNRIEILINERNLPMIVKNLDSCNDTVVMPITGGEPKVNDEGKTRIEDTQNYSKIMDGLKLSVVEFEYSTPAKKKPAKRVNKDAIIAKQALEIAELKKQLASYENDKSIVKNKVFKDTLSKCKKAVA